MARSVEVDYYQIEELFTEEERMVRDLARRFVDEEFLPLIQRCFRKGEFPIQIVPRLGELGFLGSTLPQQYGCAGLNNIAYGLISQELDTPYPTIMNAALSKALPLSWSTRQLVGSLIPYWVKCCIRHRTEGTQLRGQFT